MTKKYDLIPKDLKHPYYIVAPRYVRTSAGIRCLYLLGRALNLKGYPSFMVSSGTDPLLEIGLISRDYVQSHFDHGLTPIVIYPETAMGNILKSNVVVRYILNYAGALGGPSKFNESDYLLSYGKGMLIPEVGNEKVLHIPCADTSIFYPPKGKKDRKGRYFYASKYKNYFNLKTLPITDNMIEITRDQPESPNQLELAEIFRNAEILFCYENTSISLEARLCGCPVVLIPNISFTSIIGEAEIPKYGLAWGMGDEELKYAKNTVDQFYESYTKLEDQFWYQLDNFILDTQALAKKSIYNEILPINFLKLDEIFLNNFETYKRTTKLNVRIYRASKYLIKARGFGQFLRLLSSFLIRFNIRLIKQFLNEGEKGFFAKLTESQIKK